MWKDRWSLNRGVEAWKLKSQKEETEHIGSLVEVQITRAAEVKAEGDGGRVERRREVRWRWCEARWLGRLGGGLWMSLVKTHHEIQRRGARN